MQNWLVCLLWRILGHVAVRSLVKTQNLFCHNADGTMPMAKHGIHCNASMITAFYFFFRMLSTLCFWDWRLKTQEESAMPLSRKQIVFSSVSPFDQTELSPSWARTWRSTRLVSIERIIRSALLGCVSIRLKFKIRCLQCQEHLVILLVVRYY